MRPELAVDVKINGKGRLALKEMKYLIMMLSTD